MRLSAAFAASLRMADMRTMTKDEPNLRASSDASLRAHCSLETGPRLLLIPDHRLVQRHVVHAFRNGRRDAIEQQRFQFLPACNLFSWNQIGILGPVVGH